MELSITNNAIKRFKANLLGNPDALGLRISIKPTGCNGYSYVLDYVSDISKDDQVMTFSDVSVYQFGAKDQWKGTLVFYAEK